MKVIDRIYEYMAFKGLKPATFEKATGLSNGYIATQKKRNADIGEGVVAKILKKYNDISLEWLITGEGGMLKGAPSPAAQPAPSVEKGRPYYDVDFKCGFDELVNDQTTVPACLISFPPYDRDGVVWCNATGDSMAPEINPGDVIALQEVRDWQAYLTYGETYAIATTNGLRTIKKVRKGSTPATLLLVPVNRDAADEQEIDKALVLSVFRVLAAIKKF